MLESARLILRPWREEDQKFVGAILGDPEVMRFSDAGELGASHQEVWLRGILRAVTANELPGNLAIEHKASARVIGYVSLSRDLTRVGREESEIGFRLARSAWGRGYATEAVQRMIEAAKSITSTQRVVAIVDPHNHRSVRLIEKIGMMYERDVMFEGYDHPDHRYVQHLRVAAAQQARS